MDRYKLIFLYILFAVIIPCKALLAQNVTPDTAETDIDTAAKSELDIRYDSVLSKAALSLGASAYTDAIASYKEASALKPANVYPYKMIIYAEDLAFKQKRADDLKRRAKIRDDLSKANNAIAVKSWDSAKFLFNEVLSLNPEKTDQDYAKSKIEAIDLESARIAARIPPKPAPVVVVLPKNRREARAMRKIAERNSKLPPALISPTAQAQTQVPVQAVNTGASPIAKVVVQQKPTETSVPQKTVAATPATNQPVQRPIDTAVHQRSVAATPLTNQTAQKPTDTSKPPITIVNAPVTNQPVQRPIDTAVHQRSVFAAPPPTNQTVQKPIETSVPQRTAAAPATNQTVQRPTDTAVHQRNLAAAPPNQTLQTQTENSVSQKTIVAAPATDQPVKKKTEIVTPQRTIAAAPATNQVVHTPAQTRASQASVGTTSPSSEGFSSSPAVSSSINLVDSTNNIKFICQDISFIGTNAYIKVLIQNYSSTASFLTDTLQVSLKKNNGTLIKLEQRFISSFPVINPLGESIFVCFADASVGVGPDDIFILEMRDKTRKTKLALQIPWSVYLQQKNL